MNIGEWQRLISKEDKKRRGVMIIVESVDS